MRFGFCAAAALGLFPVWLNAQPRGIVPETLSASRQIIVVTASNWNVSGGTLRRFERAGFDWQLIGPPMPVVLGRAGLGWGGGLNPPVETGPQKKEGDGRSPAGIFPLPYAFGYAPPDAVHEIKLPYVQCTASVECVDDTNSSHYNQIVDRLSIQKVEKADWKSSEKMRLADGEYELGIFVAHNSPRSVPGAGSCIFMHVWKGPGRPTSGCTAMSVGEIEALLGWLDPRANPVLVQLPQAPYQQVQQLWTLPAIDFDHP
jgi:L,D-peptidoglycan transpeptidase YkuD (ErfK/YbiS/YcfS/YnhG family)